LEHPAQQYSIHFRPVQGDRTAITTTQMHDEDKGL